MIDYLDLSLEVARAIVAEALWDGEACTWNVVGLDTSNRHGRVSRTGPGGPTLYQGSAGIGLFLAELWGKTGDAELLPAIHGAARHAHAQVIAPRTIGFHTGHAGVGYYFARLSKLLREETYANWARVSVDAIGANVRHDHLFDVIGGAAGAIPALLRIASWADIPRATVVARRLGDHLVAQAHRSHSGWWWGTATEWQVGGLTGFAHGVAGIASGLLELFLATGEHAYRFAAEQAFAYERALFDVERGNWPDLRHFDLMTWVKDPAGRAELHAKLKAGEAITPYEKKFMYAWCHGAPGIGLARVRAFEVTGEPVYADEARVALKATVESLDDPYLSASLCHGSLGNCETLLAARRVLGDRVDIEPVKRAIDGAIGKRREMGHWVSGVLGNVHDPSLMMGDAGVGHFFLRLAAPDVPSVLLVTAPASATTEASRPDDTAREHAYGDMFFGRTRNVLEQGGHVLPHVISTEGVVARRRAAIIHAIEIEPSALTRERLIDAWRLEERRYVVSVACTDFTAITIEALTSLDPEEIDWAHDEFTLALHAELVENRFDWDAWLAAGARDVHAAPDGPATYVIFVANQSILIQRVKPFTAVVLESCRGRVATVDTIMRDVLDALDDSSASPDGIRDAVVSQLTKMLKLSVVRARRGEAMLSNRVSGTAGVVAELG